MNEVITRIRELYPQYRDFTDEDLTLRIGAKHPEYLERDDFKADYEKVNRESISDYLRQQELAKAPPGAFPTDPGTEFITAIGEDPAAFVKALPGGAVQAAMAPGQLAFRTTADLMAAIDPEHGREYGGNLAAMMAGGPLPVDKFLAEVSKTNPKLAVAGKTGKALTEMAPLAAVGMAPAWLGRLAAAGFTADMVAHAPQQFAAYAEEINKPKAEQDPDKLTSLQSSILQTFAFAPLAGAHAVGEHPITAGDYNRIAAREISRAVNAPVELPAPVTPRAQRQLGIQPAPEADVMQPGLEGLRDAALQEAMQLVKEPGKEQQALDALRRAVNPPQVVAEPTLVAERVAGGGEAPYGKVSYQRTAEAPTTERTQAAVIAENARLGNTETARALAAGEKGKDAESTGTSIESVRREEGIQRGAQEPLRVRDDEGAGLEAGKGAPPAPAAPKEIVSPVREQGTAAEQPVPSGGEFTPPSPAAKNPIDNAIANIESLQAKLRKGAQSGDVAMGVPAAILDTALEIARLALKGGKTVKEALDAALSHLRKNVRDFNESDVRSRIEAELNRAVAPAAAPAEEPAPVMITEKAAKAMEKKVELPVQQDVDKLREQLDLFNKEIEDALTTGGRFLEKELRPDVAKGAPAERGTVTSKSVNQYFVNKLVTMRREFNRLQAEVARQADPESIAYLKLARDRFEHAFRQVQELRRASHESLYFWNQIKAEYQAIAQTIGLMPEMKRQLPIIDQIVKDFRDGRPAQAGKHFVDYLRMNLFTAGSWTLDFGTNLLVAATRLPPFLVMDAAHLVTGKPAYRMATALRALGLAGQNALPLPRYRMAEPIERGLGTTAGGELVGQGREVMIDFSQIFPDHPALADRLRHLDKLIGAPVRMKRAVDNFFGRLGATAELYNSAYLEGRKQGLRGDELKLFAEKYVTEPPEVAARKAIEVGNEFKFNRELTDLEERIAANLGVKLFAEAFPRWTFQFGRWAGEMIGADPKFARKVLNKKATAEDTLVYLTKALTGWGGIYAFNQLFYDGIDANTMEYVDEHGNRTRLSGRTPVPELFFVNAVLRGDTQKAKAALAHLSLPGARLLGGEPAGLLGPFIDAMKESVRGRYTAERAASEMNKIVNDMIPGKSMLGLIRSLHDPTIREGIGAPISGVAEMLPQKINPTTGEPLAPRQRVPGTGITIPTVGGTPFPGAVRVLNDVEKALTSHGLALTRPRRTSLIELPAEDVPKELRREYEQMVGRNVAKILGEGISDARWKALPFESRREVLQGWLEISRKLARAELAQKHGTSMKPVKSLPINLELMPERLKK